ncbi:MAG: IS256 family transposase [Chloroflexi bacterium]|nr:IS256 family transposase [Chloroflexota bacterium]
MPGRKALVTPILTEPWREVNSMEGLMEDFSEQIALGIKAALEKCFECELLEQLQSSWGKHNPDRVDYRNGYRYRSLQTRLGLIKDLRVPRSREGTYQSQILPRYKRYEAGVEDLVRDSFLAGVSTRRVGEVLEPLMGGSVSASTVSEITKALDGQVQKYHQRRLPDDVVYLFADAVYMTTKGGAKAARKAVLTLYAIKTNGEKELLDFRVADSESEAQWESFLNHLYKRGLEGSQLRLIISDGGTGLHAALQMVYGHVKRQRCWVHKLRNVIGRLRAKQRAGCLAQLRTVYQAKNGTEARKEYQSWAKAWGDEAPAAVACVEKDLEELLNFFSEPANLARRLRTTNAIERCFREVRRRTNPMSCFNNSASCERIIYAIFTYQNSRWKDRPIPELTHNT